jgi:hypothetical protein
MACKSLASKPNTASGDVPDKKIEFPGAQPFKPHGLRHSGLSANSENTYRIDLIINYGQCFACFFLPSPYDWRFQADRNADLIQSLTLQDHTFGAMQERFVSA